MFDSLFVSSLALTRPQRTPQLLAAGVSRALVRCMRLVPRNVEQLRYGGEAITCEYVPKLSILSTATT